MNLYESKGVYISVVNKKFALNISSHNTPYANVRIRCGRSVNLKVGGKCLL